MNPSTASMQDWSDRLNAAAVGCRHIREVVVLAETDTTQSAALRMDLQPGVALTTGRQTRGRGRFGRQWTDDRGEGVALSVVLGEPHVDLLAARIGVATANAIKPFLLDNIHVGLKWPNDVVIDGRKIAGILIDSTKKISVVGIGVNVLQTEWNDEIRNTATSLKLLGAGVDRVDVIERLLVEIDLALDIEEAELVERYRQYDVLVGSIQSVRCKNEDYYGRVADVHPRRGLVMSLDDGRSVELPAEWTTIVKDEGGSYSPRMSPPTVAATTSSHPVDNSDTTGP